MRCSSPGTLGSPYGGVVADEVRNRNWKTGGAVED